MGVFDKLKDFMGIEEVDEDEVLKIKEDENAGVKWVDFEDVEKKARRSRELVKEYIDLSNNISSELKDYLSHNFT